MAAQLRYEGAVPDEAWRGLAGLIPLAIGLQVVLGFLFALYLGRARFGSFDEVAALAVVVGANTVALFALNLIVFDRLVPASIPLAGGIGALLLSLGIRYSVRSLRQARRRPTDEESQRTLVFGAGEGGAQAVRAMLSDPRSRFVPVALLDDDPTKRRLRIMGVPVVGSRESIADAATNWRAEAMLIAIPDASAELVRELAAMAGDADLEVRVLPPTSELFGGRVGLGDIRPLTEADLLGRHQVEIDMNSVARYLTGKRVLVTGAGGSIGAELCRQISRFEPAALTMLDRDESALHAVQLSIERMAPLDTPNLVVADIREDARLRQVFDDHLPDVVFHAAALKHVPLLELYPGEAVKTNVLGTQHVLDAALACGVERVVTISTDKAADPVNVLGYTKRIAERLTAQAAEQCGKPYLSVRFGNVLGSRGSVLETFRAQIEAGGPVTVTDPEVTRYFMTVEEAVLLTIQAGALGEPGETLVLDMGEPVSIAEVAGRLVESSARPIDITYTGLRRGEKLHETRLAADEADRRPCHPLISHVEVPPLSAEAVDRLGGNSDDTVLIAQLSSLCEADAAFRWSE